LQSITLSHFPGKPTIGGDWPETGLDTPKEPNMAARATLHQLVDELPEEALEATFRVLENFQKWPPKGHADAEQLLKQTRERFRRGYDEHARRTGGGIISGGAGSGSFSPDGYGSASTQGWEGHTAVTAKVHFFRSHELHTLERISLSDDRRKLLFSVEGKMPNGRAERHDFFFDLAEAGS